MGSIFALVSRHATRKLLDMTTRPTQNVLDINTGLLAVMREFLKSVEILNQTVLFPVKLQDMDNQSRPSMDDQLMQLVRQSGEAKELDMLAIYRLLLNTRSELLTGNDVMGFPSNTDNALGQQILNLATMLKSMTELANTIRRQYESSLITRQ